MTSKFYTIAPEVSGGWGRGTVVDTSTSPPNVLHLDYCFDDIPRDCIVTSFPCFIVTRKVAGILSSRGISGISFEEIDTTVSGTFVDLNGTTRPPEFVRLLINGQHGISDFWLDNDFQLVVSQTALDILIANGLSEAEVTARG